MKLIKKMFVLLLFSGLLILLNINIKATVTINSGQEIKITFSDGVLPEVEYGELLFNDFYKTATVNVSNNLIVPDFSFGEIDIVDEYKGNNKLDPETFYFSDRNVHTLTGWHIVGTSEYLPAKTVFQLGDVITYDVLEQYVILEDGIYTLKLEAVWGKCYFIQNPYENMKYTYGLDGHPWCKLDKSLSTNPTAASDDNDGLTPDKPKATIVGLYDVFRKQLFTDKTQDAYDAYRTVVMLVGELDYIRDTDEKRVDANGNIMYNSNGTAISPSGAFGQYISDSSKAFISATFKSLNNLEGTLKPYNFVYKPKGYTNQIYGNIRFDNINMIFPKSDVIYYPVNDGIKQQNYSGEFQLYNSTKCKNYFETTARYNQSIPSDRSAAIVTLRTSNHELVVLNGGSFGTFQNSWSTTINMPNKTLEWYIGRNAIIRSEVHCGTTAAYADTTTVTNVNYKLTVTGGRIGSIHGGSKGVNATSKGLRKIEIMGDGSSVEGAYTPVINNVFGGAHQAKLYGTIMLNISNCNFITNVYGGGDEYTATTYGNISINIKDSVINGDLYGGGKNANSEINPDTKIGGDVLINIVNSSVLGDIYGSGMGMTQTISTTENRYYFGTASNWYNKDLFPSGYYVDGWQYPVGYDENGNLNYSNVDYYPKYDPSTGYVTLRGEKFLSWTEINRDTLTIKYTFSKAYLSLATVENVTINVDNSIIGAEATNKGNIYGGGSIARVLGDTNINITGKNTIVFGSVYGGGDGVSVPAPVKVYKVLDKNTYNAPTYSITSYLTNGLPGVVTLTNEKPATTTSEYGTFYWSNDASLLDLENPGVDLENKLLYSPNTVGLGAVLGDTVVNITDATIKGSVYGGGNKGNVDGSTNLNISGNATVANAYAGSNQADIGGNSTLNINSGVIINAYGANNLSGNIKGFVDVNVSGGNIDNLYGGGNKAHDDYLTTITIEDGIINNLYGGGKKASVGEVILDVKAGKITTLFGGGDQGDTLGKVTIKVSNGTIDTLYSGANKANIGGNVTTTILDGTILNLFGGNNVSGDITGSVNVTIDDGTITNLYGGGNQADDNYTSTITLYDGLINVLYGGGKEADITGSIINLNGGKVETNLYGGGFAGNVTDTVVNISGGEITNNLYGGGFEGDVINSIINISQGIFGGNIYGGGYAGTAETTKVQVIENSSNYGTISIAGSVFGGGEGLTASVYKTTDVLVNLNLELIAEEVAITTENESPIKSGTTSTTVTFNEGYSKIAGNVYGGGDLGQVGVGFIDKNSNTATISVSGSTKVIVENGYIGGSVFGGGSGVPAQGMIYELRMGTIYGNTETYIKGGYIANNVYGGGTQSRLYQNDSDDVTASVNIVEEDYPIVIGGSVFGGGDRGNSATTNASVPTTIGNVEVNITGKGSGLSKIYFLNGGVYGDGNLCLVRGNRIINITDFTMAKKDELKTFYSLQRADVVNLDNSNFVLLGAIDLVEEGDLTVYSINRVNTINFINGSTIKLDQIVKYLSNITSDYEQDLIKKDRVYINNGYNGSNGYNEKIYKDTINALTSDEIEAYQQNSSETKNTICVANGLYLELKNNDINNTYGTIKGLFTLQLLKAVPGEGGGFVYASINDELGDFICETLYTEGGKDYMPIVDDVGGINSYNEFTYYVWFIQGRLINYEIGITGYIGSEQTSYEETTIIPNHNVKLDYVLKQIEVEDDNPLVSAIKGEKYYLTNKKDNLLGQEIALEIRIGNTTLGYLGYENEKWGINAENVDGDNISYNFLTGYNIITEYKNNVLMNDVVVDKNNNQISIILHKSTGVNAEVSGMEVSFGVELFTDEGIVYSDGTCNLNYRVGFSIVRLVPEQSVYSNTGNLFAGVGTNEIIKITSGSSFTMEYQTKYIPRAFPETGGKTMNWSLSVKGYSYFMDELGNYLTIDSNGNCISISPTLAFDVNKNGVMDDGENPDKKSFVIKNNSTGIYEYSHGEKTIKMDKQNTTLSNSVIKKGTKITLIDLSNDKKPSYYYYIVKEDIVDELNLDKFMIMGTNITIGSITDRDDSKYPLFKKLYTDGDASRIAERLVIIFDFEQSITSDFNGIISLNHRYGTITNNIDIMDYVKSKKGNSIDEISYIRSIPKPVEYEIIDSAKNDGVQNIQIELEKEEYIEEEVINLSVEVLKDANYTNTQYENGEIGIILELADGSSLPNGIEFRFNGITYYPKHGNKYVIIPIKNYGKYNIQVANVFGFNSKTDKTINFKTTLCYLPDNEFDNRTIVRAKDIGSVSGVCTIKCDNSSAMKVTIVDRVISKTEKLVIEVKTLNCKSNVVTMNLGTISYPIGLVSGDGKLEIDLNSLPQIQVGSYTLEFKVDEHIEKINVIITE